MTISLGIIGCGSVVNGRHVEALNAIVEKRPGLLEVVAVCDNQEERARKVAERIAVFQDKRVSKTYTDYECMLEEESLDAVSVATPHFAHHKPTIDALNSGVHVVVEKPFAITVKAGQKMIEAAERNKRVLACVHPLRRKFQNRLMDWIVNEARLIGDPRFSIYMRIWESYGVHVGTPWRYDRMKAGGGWSLDGEVHEVDFLRMVFGDVDEVYAKTPNFEPTRYFEPETLTNPVPSDVEDGAFAMLTFKSGLIGNYIWTSNAIGEGITLLKGATFDRYYGSEGSMKYTGYGREIPREMVQVRIKGGGKISPDELEKRFIESLSREEKDRIFPLGMQRGVSSAYIVSFYDFFDAILNRRPPEVGGREALAAVAVIESMYESNVKGSPVKVKDVLEGRIDTYQQEINEYWKM